jgi:cell shape-determining protein MreC
VIEFPPGSTILIPSSAVAHSNIPIQKGETRYSFTQYSPSGIFRWVDHGFQTEKQFFESLSPAEAQEERLKQSNQLDLGLSLYSTVDELTCL